MTGPSKRNLERRLDDLEADGGGGSSEDGVTIRSVRVDENGDPVEVCRVLEIRTDEHGTQHTERTEYDRGEGPDP
jgi:hypothetical protein